MYNVFYKDDHRINDQCINVPTLCLIASHSMKRNNLRPIILRLSNSRKITYRPSHYYRFYHYCIQIDSIKINVPQLKFNRKREFLISFQFQTQRMSHLFTLNIFTHICASSGTVSLRHDYLNCMQICFEL